MQELAATFRQVRAQFPALERTVSGAPLVYLDNAATTLKPRRVVEVLAGHYLHSAANVRRGVHALGSAASAGYEQSRQAVCAFLNAAEPAEIVFTSGATAALNLVARGLPPEWLRAGDEVLVSGMEHHANLVPWHRVCKERGCALRAIPVQDDGRLDLDAYATLLSPRTRVVAVTAVSNVLGTINPIAELAAAAHAHGAVVVVDGAQAVAHAAVDVRAWGCDFFAFSAHKVFGPSGVGVLYGRRERLERIEPVAGGGGAVRHVSFDEVSYADLPARLEPGTPAIGAALALGEALAFVTELDRARIERYERALLQHATQLLSAIPGLRLLGTAPHKAPIVSFTLAGVHAHDLGTLLDQDGIAVRVGHHCAQPLMRRFGVEAAARASFCFYNTFEEAEALAVSIRRAQKVFA